MTKTYYKRKGSDWLYQKKPDMKKWHEEKEQERIERMAELEECARTIQKALQFLTNALDE